MATIAAQVRANTALQLLAGNHLVPLDDDSDHEPTIADFRWDWIYAPAEQKDERTSPARGTSPSRRPRKPAGHGKQRIIGARLGKFTIHIGDTVTLKADRNDVWVAIINKFLDPSDADADLGDQADDIEAEDDDSSGKKALFTWLSSPREIRNPRHRRLDCLPNELYATANSDVNPLEAIMGRATILSPADAEARFPGGKIPKGHPDAGRVFVCRRGANLRTITYTDEFTWGVDVMQGKDGGRETQELIEKVERETVKTRKRRIGGDTTDGLKDFVVDDEDGEPKTPRKKRKLDAIDTTPRKRGPAAGTTPKRTPQSKFTTPTHKRIVEKKPLEFTPLGTRIISKDQSAYASSPHAQARTHLHVASVPASLPCREEEFSTVYTHLDSAISDGTGACIYISGTPGTGKTATVREVVAQLHASVKADELDDFNFVEINGMRLTDPHHSYSMLWEALTDTRVAPGHALSLLNQEFSRPSPRRTPVVVLMDELDQLATRSQGVMYNFFQWPTQRHSRLIVLAVANTMDLPERTLSNKISSRLGLTRIVFQGYTHQQLMKIVETRLANVSGKDVVVDADAIQFAARKVAGVSGDARRCLDICRRAVELAEADNLEPTGEEEDDAAPATPSKTGRNSKPATAASPTVISKKGRVTIATVQRAIRESTSSPLAQALRSAPLAAKLFLAALLARGRRTGVADATVGDVLDEARRLAATCALPAVTDWLLAVTVTDADSGPADARRRKGLARRDDAGADFASGELSTRPVPRVLGLSAVATELLDAGVLAMEERRGERAARCRLLVGEEDVKSALRGDEEVRGLGFDS